MHFIYLNVNINDFEKWYIIVILSFYVIFYLSMIYYSIIEISLCYRF